MMYSKLWNVCIGLILLTGSAITGPVASAQFKSTQATRFQTHTSNHESDQPDETHEFEIQAGVSLSLMGIQQTLSFGMIDELGARRDTFHILNMESVRQDLGITEEQYQKILDANYERSRLLEPMVASIATGTKSKSDVKTLFLEIEDEINAVLTPDQFEQLAIAKDQSAIQTHGLVKYLGMKENRQKYGLPGDEIKNLEIHLTSTAKDAVERQKSLLRMANEQLLERLSDSQMKKLKLGLEENGIEKFVESEMFTENVRSHKKPTRKYSDPLRTLGLKRLSKKLKVSDSQREELDSLAESLPPVSKRDRVKAMERMAEILEAQQMVQLNQYIADRQLKRSGTVFTLIHGFLPDVIGMKPEQADRLYEQAVEIYDEMESSLNQDRRKAALTILDRVDLKRRAELKEILDGAVFR